MTAKQNNSLFQTPTIILSVECQLLNQKTICTSYLLIQGTHKSSFALTSGDDVIT